VIVYLSSYPRSGNMWLISIVGNILGVLPVDIHYNNDKIEVFSSYASKVCGIQVEPFPALKPFSVEELRSFLVLYRHELSSHVRVGLRQGGLESIIQRKDIREALAADEEVYFFKTHFLPYEKYFPGEKVVQIVRHPGASIWSFYLFLNRKLSYALKDALTGKVPFRLLLKRIFQPRYSLEDALTGKVPFGAWSDYHQTWFNAADSLGNQYFRLSYEDLFGHEEDYGRKLGEWLGLPALGKSVPSFSYLHSLGSVLVRKGEPDDWKLNFSDEQMAMLFEIHGNTMKRLGYS
jgi:sulfotransferase family protein